MLCGLSALALLAGCDRGGSAAEAAARACAPGGDHGYICGLSNPEDIVAIGDTGWLVASSYVGTIDGKPGAGRLYLIDAAAKAARELFPGEAPELRLDAASYPGCPGPLDLQAFDTLGLSIRETSPGVHRLYVASHGAVQAIQAFEIDARGEEPPRIAWVGCVPLPAGAWANSVAMLPDGGFVATSFFDTTSFDPSDPEARRKLWSGEIAGQVYEWRPGGEVAPIPGAELPAPNGVEVSPDGRYLYVADIRGEVVRFDRSASPAETVVLSLPQSPDNLRWTPDGQLMTVGEDRRAPDCKGKACEPSWTIYRIDPAAMTATRVGIAELDSASTALEARGTIWLGTAYGDRLGYMPAR